MSVSKLLEMRPWILPVLCIGSLTIVYIHIVLFIYSSIHPSIHSFIYLFIHSFINMIIRVSEINNSQILNAAIRCNEMYYFP